MNSRLLLMVLVCALFCNKTRAAMPATVEQAAAKLDLRTLPLPAGAELGGPRRLAELSYTVKGTSKDTFDFVNRELSGRGWKTIGEMQEQGDFVGADYRLDGYQVHVSVFPQGLGVAHVVITHQGNVPLEEVPVPAGVEKVYAFPSTVMYKASGGVEETAQACRGLMMDNGWQPYGGAGDTAYYRQNAVQVDLNVMSAPGQGGATVISVSSKLLSLELPAPAFADDFRYTDGTTAIMFDTDASSDEAFAYYRGELAERGWKATTDEPFKLDWKLATIFRNAGQEMITLTTHDFEGKTRVQLDHQNASEVADEEFRSLESAGEKAKYGDVTWITVELTAPAGTKPENVEDWAVKFNVDDADSFQVAEKIVSDLAAAGWKPTDEKPAEEPVIRSYQMTKGDHTVRLVAVKPPKLSPWVGVVGVGGVKFEVAEK